MTRRVWVAGYLGMVGSAIVRRLEPDPEIELVLTSHKDLDLCDGVATLAFLRSQHIDEIYLAAARVGGIHANDSYPVGYIRDNLLIEANTIGAAHEAGIQKLLFLGSSCIYPRAAEQPLTESALLTGPLEPTNEPYAMAKIAGIKLCESFNRQYGRDYRSVMPTNLYGPGDNYHDDMGHVIPALMNRLHKAARHGSASVSIWGSGRALREFMHVDDAADAFVHVMNLDSATYRGATRPTQSHINVGTGAECSIAYLATTIARQTGFAGDLAFDRARPDGTPRKLLDVSLLSSLGWRSQISLEDGLADTYRWLLDKSHAIRSDARGAYLETRPV